MFDELVAQLKELDIPTAWHSFVAVPKAHCFATYNTPQIRFDGGDQYAMFKHISAEIVIFYKDGKTEADFELENRFEDAVRFAGNFKKECGFDSANALFFSCYSFEFGENY